MSKYEQLIEYIINEQEDKARELFHQIVVEKSRDIYESLIDEQDLEEVGGNEVENMVDEITGDEEGMQEAEDDDMGDDMGDDDGMDMDGEDDGMDMGDDDGMDMGGEDDMENRVMDLEDALDELKSEFDALMGGDDGMDDGMDMGMDMGDDEGDEDMGENLIVVPTGETNPHDMGDYDESVYEAKKSKKEEMLNDKDKKAKKMTEAEWIREYVEKIGEYPGNQATPSGAMAGTGAKSEKQGEKNTKSPVGPGVNMGGNVVKTKGGEQNPDGKQIEQPTNEYSKGKGDLPGAGKYKNVPGANSGKSSFKTKENSNQSSPTGKMVGTGKNSEQQGEKNVKPLLKHIGK